MPYVFAFTAGVVAALLGVLLGFRLSNLGKQGNPVTIREIAGLPPPSTTSAQPDEPEGWNDRPSDRGPARY